MDANTGSKVTRVLAILIGLGVALGLPMALVWTKPDVVQGDAVRLLYIHVPSAWAMYLSVIAISLGSIMWLSRRSVFWDTVAEAAGEVGVGFCALTLVTGMIWGDITWNTPWVWDARLTSTAVLSILVAGHVALRRATLGPDARATRSAWLGLALLPNAAIVHFAVDWWRGLHQEATLGPTGATIEGLQLFTWMFWGVLFALVWTWLMIHGFRTAFMARRIDEGGVTVALAERRAAAEQNWTDSLDVPGARERASSGSGDAVIGD